MSFGLCDLHSDIVYLTRNKQLVSGTNRLGNAGIQLHQFGNGEPVCGSDSRNGISVLYRVIHRFALF